MSETVDFDLTEVVKGNQESITAKLGQLSSGELSTLHVLESKADKPRKGVLEAIEREQESRPPEQGEDPKVAAAADDAAAISVHGFIAKNQLDILINELIDGGVLKAGDEFSIGEAAVTALRDRATKIADLEAASAAKDARIAGLEQALAKTDGKGPKSHNLAMPKTRKPLEPDDYRVVFGGSAGRSLPAIPALQFSAAQFEQRGEHMLVLAEAIRFDTGLPREEVHSIVLMRGSGAVAKCQLMRPLAVGGGRGAEMPAGSVAFRNDD